MHIKIEGNNMKERCNKLLSHIRNTCTDAVMITSPINIRYFSGFTGSNGVIVITKNKKVLFTDSRYTIQAGIETKGLYEVCEVKGPINHEVIGDFLSDQKCAFLGYEEDYMTVKQYLAFKKLPYELVDISRLLARIRMTKSQDEIDKIIKAQNISDRAFSELLSMISVGMTEREVANELDYFLKKFGADEPAFDTIVASGPNGALPHATPSDRKLQHGDMVVIDFGSKYEGYCSDMTRTIAIGEPNEELRKIYRIVLEAQVMAMRAVKPGVECKKIDAVARACIAARGYGKCFGHSLGHGFGLEVHEAPAASERSTDVLMPNMTLTVEPGIYVEGLGGVRIEDCLIITENGYINPVSTTKDLIIIE